MFGETVVQQKHRAGLQPVGQGAHKGLGLRMDLGQVVVAARHVEWRPQGGRLIGRNKHTALNGDTALLPDAVHTGQQLHRHGVQHLVADHHTLHLSRQFADPLHGLAPGGQALALVRLQAAGEIHDRVPPNLRAQGLEQLLRQRAGTRAELPDLGGAGSIQRLRHLPRQRLAKTRGKLGRGDKIAAAALHAGGHEAELARITGVIAQTRGVQGHGHETVKTDPATGSGDSPADVRGQGAR